MANAEIDLLKSYANEVVNNNLSVSRDSLELIYNKYLQTSGGNELAKVSELWINYYWKKLSVIDKATLANALKNEKTFIRFARETLS